MNLLDSNDAIGQYPPSWYAASIGKGAVPEQPKLLRNLWVKTCIIGAGYSGLSCALHLAAQQGHDASDICVIDAHRIGWGASGRNGGQLGSGQRLDQIELEKLTGKDAAHKLWDLGQDSKKLVKSLAKKHAPNSKFRPGIIHANHRARFNQYSRDETSHLRDEYGYDAIQYLDEEAVRAIVGSQHYFGGTYDTDSGHLHPLRFALGLGKAAIEAGVQFYENTRAVKIVPGHPVKIITENGVITAENLVIACNGYLGGLDKKIAERVMPINNFVIATEPLSEEMAKSVLNKDVAVADSKFVVNYFRLSEDNRLLFGGRESYGYKFPRDIRQFVRKPMLQIFPQLSDIKIEYGWGGTLAITMNRLPNFERVASNITSISGYSGHGVGMATLAGKLAADSLAGNSANFEKFRSIGSKSFPGGVALRAPLLVLAMLYHSMLDKF